MSLPGQCLCPGTQETARDRAMQAPGSSGQPAQSLRGSVGEAGQAKGKKSLVLVLCWKEGAMGQVQLEVISSYPLR